MTFLKGFSFAHTAQPTNIMSGFVEARHTLVRLLYQLISELAYACIPICLGWRHSQNKGGQGMAYSNLA